MIKNSLVSCSVLGVTLWALRGQDVVEDATLQKALQGRGGSLLTMWNQALSLSKISPMLTLLYGIIHFSVHVHKLVSSGLSDMVLLPGERSEKINKLPTRGAKSTEI